MAWTEAEPQGRVRGWLRGNAPASVPAQVFMALAMLLCGGVLAGLLFVGFWRHSASQATTARAAQVDDQARLRTAERTLLTLQSELARVRGLLAGAGRRNASLAAEVAAERSANTAMSRSLTSRLKPLAQGAGALARQTAALQSELATLQTYAVNPGPAGLDTGYLANQARYLATAAGGAASAATELVRAADFASAALAGRSR